MEIVFKKSANYICHICDNQFNWSNDSWRFGKMEYETVIEQQNDEKYFCSTVCKNKFKQ